MSNIFHSHFPPGGYPTVEGGGMFSGGSPPLAGPEFDSPVFDIFQWHVAYQSCQRYFLNHAQHNPHVQATAAFINICLPFQWTANPVVNSAGPMPHSAGPAAYNLPWPRQGPVMNASNQAVMGWVSLIPYIQRLVVTGMDKEGIMKGFFGEDWRKGVGPFHECERRNYLFAAKKGGWGLVVKLYNISPHESVPFYKPLQDVQLAEIEGAEKVWSQWLAMEDWMVGPRAPDAGEQDQHAS